MAEPLRLTVLTPARTLLDATPVMWLQAHLADGAPIGIYPSHAPLLAETVSGPLRYADASGEHALDLAPGILQVGDGEATLLTSGIPQATHAGDKPQPAETSQGQRFDRLARQLMITLRAQPGGVLDMDDEARR